MFREINYLVDFDLLNWFCNCPGTKSVIYLSLSKSLFAAIDLMSNVCFQQFLKTKTTADGDAKVRRINIKVRLAEMVLLNKVGYIAIESMKGLNMKFLRFN